MPAPDLILPGFYGKLPTAGDFVTRRLSIDFVQAWDRWLAQHLAPLIASELWDESVPLRFLSGSTAFGPATGIVLSSADRVGRRFPLSIVALLPEASVGLARTANAWFVHLEEAGISARLGKLTPDQLDAALSLFPAPHGGPDGEIIDGMVVWTENSDLYDLDPDAPRQVLEELLVPNWETS
jgi:type VI secretion system protein ImpM